MDELLDEEYEGRTFEGLTIGEEDLSGRYFDRCTFVSCHFAGTDFSRSQFRNCSFSQCSLTAVRLDKVKMRTVSFDGVRIGGLDFSRVEPTAFKLSFKLCKISDSNFFGLRLEQTPFDDCEIVRCDFVQNNMASASFSRTVFRETTFRENDLSSSDFSTAEGYLVDAASNKLKMARFSLPEAVSLLDFLGIRLV